MTRYCIFDFDGTIADTTLGILRTTEATLERMGLPECDLNYVKSHIGLPLKGHLAAAGIPEERLDEAVDVYHELFYEVAPAHITIFDGMKQVFAELSGRGVHMAIATSRGAHSLRMLLEEHGIAQYFEVLGSVECSARPKPNPDLVLWVLDQWGAGASAADTLVVGDTTFDLLMGSNAGCRTCGVSWGNHSREMLATAEPDYIVGSPVEMLQCFD